MLSGTTLWFIGAVNDTWDTTTANWSDGTNTVAWQNGDTAVFDGTVPQLDDRAGAAISAAEVDFTGDCTITAGTGASLAVSGSGDDRRCTGNHRHDHRAARGQRWPDARRFRHARARRGQQLHRRYVDRSRHAAIAKCVALGSSSGVMRAFRWHARFGRPSDRLQQCRSMISPGAITNSDTGVAAYVRRHGQCHDARQLHRFRQRRYHARRDCLRLVDHHAHQIRHEHAHLRRCIAVRRIVAEHRSRQRRSGGAAVYTSLDIGAARR